ncbi:MAG: fibronectin type III domain-containing protein [Chloroflexi bacterium]|nr:fibronectin type III domain-containing protein [Chloroflexota bacterium]
MRKLGVMAMLAIFFLSACSDIETFEDFDAVISTTPDGIRIVAPALPEKIYWTPNRSPGHIGRIIPHDIETLIDTSDTIAKVRPIEVVPYIAVITPQHLNGDVLYSPYMGFKFEVLEYLMGGKGHSNIWGMVRLDQADSSSEEEALAAYTFYLNRRDTSWDGREAVVFLSDSLPDWPSTHASDRYALGFFESEPLVERHSIAANRGWLPLASEGGATGASGSSDSNEFLLDHPDGCVEFRPECSASGASGTSGSSASASTVGLEELKRKIAAQIADPGLVDRLHLEEARRNMTELMTVYDLTATATHDSVTLRWNEPGPAVEFVSGYRILRREQTETDFVPVADVPSVNEERNCAVCAATYEDTTGLESGTEYVYLVRALTANPNNGTDAQVVVTTAGMKPTPTATAESDGGVSGAIDTPTPTPTAAGQG